MADIDFSNPLMVIVGFFGIMMTIFLVLIRVLMVGFINPMAGIAVGFVAGLALFTTMNER